MEETTTIDVLLIEDHPGDVRLIREFLAESGAARFRLASAGRLDAGLQRLVEEDMDVLLLDLTLPDSRGLETFIRARARAPEMPIVVLTGLTDESVAMRAMQEGAQDYLVKGEVDGRLLARALRYAIERKRVERALQAREQFLSLLKEITHAALETPNLKSMLQMLADRLGELVGADGCYMLLWDQAAQRPIPMSAYGAWRERYASLQVAPGEKTVTAAVLAAGQPLAIEDVFDTPYVSRRLAEQFPDRSLLGLPLLAGGEKLGAALIAFNRPHTFTPEEIARGEQAAELVALSVAKALLVEELENKVAARTAEILAEKERSETILRSVGDAIAMVDLEMRIQYINDGFTALTGYGSEEMMGQPVEHLLDRPMSEPDQHALQSALRQGELWQGEATVRRRDGRTYEAMFTIAPVQEADGRRLGYVTSHRDISRLKALERARNRFITNISHQLRTPATNLKLYAKLAGQNHDREKSAKYLEVLGNQANWLCHLVDDILEITVLDSGQAVETWQMVNLPTLVRDALLNHQSQAQSAGLTLEATPPPPELPAVRGDPARLGQALSELLENAMQFTPPGGRVTVEMGTVEEDGHLWATLAVRDTGPGIPPEEQGRIFERFFRGRLADPGHIPGTGLGLSIAQEIARAHGGRLWVTSEPGKGSVFTLLIKGSTSLDPTVPTHGEGRAQIHERG